jgi:hypothetical protein
MKHPQGPFPSTTMFPRTNRAPLTAAGRSEDLSMRRERGQMQRQNHSQLAALCGLTLVGPSCTTTLE